MLIRYYRELLNFVSKASKDRDAAADIVQETYARVLAVQRSGQAISEPRALLYRTARNLQIDQHRREEIRGEARDSDAAGSMDELAQLRAAAADEPEAALSSSQQMGALLATISGLPLRCREAFILHKFDGLPQAEVARRMGISPKMVEQHIKKAMIACRQCRDDLGQPSRASAPPLPGTPKK